MPENKHLRFFVILFYCFLAFLALFILFRYIIHWLLPFLLAYALAALIEKPVSFTQKHLHLPRALASGIFTLGAVFGLGTAVWFICTKILGQISQLVRSLPDSATLLMGLARMVQRLPREVSDVILRGAEAVLQGGFSLPQGWLEGVGTVAAKTATTLPGVLFACLVTLLATFFISSDRASLIALAGFFPQRWKSFGSATRRAGVKLITCYLRSAGLMLTLTFALLAVGLGFLRIRYAVGIAFLVALVDAVPVLGTGVVLLPWALARLLGGDVPTAIGLTVLYLIVVTVRNLVEPKILGTQIGLPPLLTLLSLYIGIRVFGAFGIFLPIPVALILQFVKQSRGETTAA